MRKFDVAKRRKTGALVVSIQSNHLSELDTRLVVPLVAAGSRNRAILRLNPIIDLDGVPYQVATENAAALKLAEFGDRKSVV